MEIRRGMHRAGGGRDVTHLQWGAIGEKVKKLSPPFENIKNLIIFA